MRWLVAVAVSTLMVAEMVAQSDKPFDITVKASAMGPGGYVKYDPEQRMIVSAAAGGPSENYSARVSVPRAARYALYAMWAAAVETEVHVYTKAPAKSCTDPNLNMDDATLHYYPPPTGGWSRGNLPRSAKRIGLLTLQAGTTTLLFTSRSCGGGKGGGRLPSIAWLRLVEVGPPAAPVPPATHVAKADSLQVQPTAGQAACAPLGIPMDAAAAKYRGSNAFFLCKENILTGYRNGNIAELSIACRPESLRAGWKWKIWCNADGTHCGCNKDDAISWLTVGGSSTFAAWNAGEHCTINGQARPGANGCASW